MWSGRDEAVDDHLYSDRRLDCAASAHRGSDLRHSRERGILGVMSYEDSIGSVEVRSRINLRGPGLELNDKSE